MALRKGAAGWISRLHAALAAERFVLFGQEIRVGFAPGHGVHRPQPLCADCADGLGGLVRLADCPHADGFLP